MTDEAIIKDRDYYRANRHKYEFPKFTLDKPPHGKIELVMAIPKKNYDAFKILEMFDEYMGEKKPPESGFLKTQDTAISQPLNCGAPKLPASGIDAIN